MKKLKEKQTWIREVVLPKWVAEQIGYVNHMGLGNLEITANGDGKLYIVVVPHS